MTLSLYLANGTGAAGPWDPGQYPVQVAEALMPSGWQILADQLDGLQTVSQVNVVPTDYAASIYPMGASVAQGVAVMVSNIQGTPVGSPKGLLGYSQGGIVTSTVWRDYILNPNGVLYPYLGDFLAGGSVTWGNPMRAPGKCNGNLYAGWALQSGGGISGLNDLLPSQTPDNWLDFADPNDLYTDSPVAISADGKTIMLNSTAEDEMLIYNLIVAGNFGGTLLGLLKIVENLVEQFHAPLSEIIGIATAIWNGLTFASAGPNAGHYTYNITPAITFLRQVAQAAE